MKLILEQQAQKHISSKFSSTCIKYWDLEKSLSTKIIPSCHEKI